MTLDHAYADLPNGMRLHYVAAGSGPLLVFVHGFPEFWYEWKEQLAEFSRDHRVIIFSLTRRRRIGRSVNFSHRAKVGKSASP